MASKSMQLIFEALKQRADADESYGLRCINCKELVVFLEHREALGEGHIYSPAGRSEYGISRMCEYCFDVVTDEENFDYMEESDMPNQFPSCGSEGPAKPGAEQ